MNVDFGKFAQIAQTYSGRGIDQTARRRDNEHAAYSLRRAGEGIGVGKLAAKIESAEKGEDFTQSRTFAAAQSPGQIELSALAQNHAGALATGIGGRKQKDAIGFNLFHGGYLQKKCGGAGRQPFGGGARRGLALPRGGWGRFQGWGRGLRGGEGGKGKGGKVASEKKW